MIKRWADRWTGRQTDGKNKQTVRLAYRETEEMESERKVDG